MGDNDTKKTVILEDRTRAYDGFFKIDLYQFRRTRHDGSLSKVLKNEVFERGDAAAVLVRDVVADTIILAKQFRLPAHLRRDPETDGDAAGWILETMAGVIKPGESPLDCARRELLEELGYQVFGLEPIGRFFVSPGGTTERIHLFYGEVSPGSLVNPDAVGIAEEQEDVQRETIPLTEFFEMIRDGRIADAKTIIAGQWLELKLTS